jgi:glycosyltransferase involved in cell wall biosynthesis
MSNPPHGRRSVDALRVAHVVHSLAPEHGGPSITVPALCDELGQRGMNVSLHASAFGKACTLRPRHYTLHTYPNLPGGGRLGISPPMHRALRRAARECSIVHAHGLWLWTNLDAHLVTRRAPARTVISPRGMLEAYAIARRRWVKRALWALGQGAAVRAADCLHVTSESEHRSLRALGLRNPVAIIPNGVAMPQQAAEFAGGRRRLLYLGRIDPKKGLDFLIDAWTEVALRFPEWDLQIVGPDQVGHRAELEARVRRLATPRVTFSDAVYGAARDALLATADLFALPTRSENFGMTVAEAMAAGLPVICSKGAPWPDLPIRGAGYWIEVGTAPLVRCLDEALALSRERARAMGERGRAWVHADFGWDAQAAKMAQVYQWLVAGGAPPSVVYLATD